MGVYNPSIGEAETGRSLAFAGQPYWWNGWTLGGMLSHRTEWSMTKEALKADSGNHTYMHAGVCVLKHVHVSVYKYTVARKKTHKKEKWMPLPFLFSYLGP